MWPSTSEATWLKQEPPCVQLFLALNFWSQKSLKNHKQAPPGPYRFPVKQEPDNAPHHNDSCDVTDASSRTPNTACEVLHTLNLVQRVKHLGGRQPQPQGCKFLQWFKSKGRVCSVCSNTTQKFNYLYILSKTREHLTQQLLHIS